MFHLVNGQACSKIDIFDRGYCYGHAVFETIAVVDQQLLLLDDHLIRLEQGCRVLSIDFNLAEIHKDIEKALAYLAKHQVQRAVLRLTLSMVGAGRGYQIPANACTNRVLSLSVFPEFEHDYRQKGITLGIVDLRLSQQPALAGLKTTNRLEQVIARQQWQADWQEALLLDMQSNVVEATQSNFFIFKNNKLITPSLNDCGVAGVVRKNLFHIAKELGIIVAIESVSVEQLKHADELFVCNSLIGIWPVNKLVISQQESCFFNDFSISNQLLRELINHGAVSNH